MLAGSITVIWIHPLMAVETSRGKIDSTSVQEDSPADNTAIERAMETTMSKTISTIADGTTTTLAGHTLQS